MIIDCAWNTKKHIYKLLEEGVVCVIRYYNYKNSTYLPEKGLTLDEAKALGEAGIDVAVIFQANARKISSFTESSAKGDASRALKMATQIGQPTGSAIYFAVDTDFYRSSHLNIVKKYFDIVQSKVRQAGYKVGVYSSGGVADMLGGLVDYVWIARASKWFGTKEALKAGRWDLYQYKIETHIGSLMVDLNKASLRQSSFGAFNLSENRATEFTDEHNTAPLYRVTASKLVLRGGPSKEYDNLNSFPRGTLVKVLGRNGGWALVGIDTDHQPDGFMSLKFLEPVNDSQTVIDQEAKRPVNFAYEELSKFVQEIKGPAVHPRIQVYYDSITDEPKNDEEEAWCSYFVNFCVEQAGGTGTESAAARSWLKWGNKQITPKPGDIVVFWRKSKSSWEGHVAFYLGHKGNEILCLGGNQDNGVSLKRYSADKLLGYRRAQ
jgi:uncharacterized protein (TIGR02594 family)